MVRKGIDKRKEEDLIKGKISEVAPKAQERLIFVLSFVRPSVRSKLVWSSQSSSFQVSFRSLLGLFQVSLRNLLSLSLRSLSGLS